MANLKSNMSYYQSNIQHVYGLSNPLDIWNRNLYEPESSEFSFYEPNTRSPNFMLCEAHSTKQEDFALWAPKNHGAKTS